MTRKFSVRWEEYLTKLADECRHSVSYRKVLSMLTKQRKVANVVTKSIVTFTNFKYKFYLWGEFMKLANVIKKYRKLNNWSQDELADILKVSRQSVSKWESGKNYPSLDILVVMSDLFGVTLD